MRPVSPLTPTACYSLSSFGATQHSHPGAATRNTETVVPAIWQIYKPRKKLEKRFLFHLLQRHTQRKGKGQEKQLEINSYLINRKDPFTEIYFDPRVQVIKLESGM